MIIIECIILSLVDQKKAYYTLKNVTFVLDGSDLLISDNL